MVAFSQGVEKVFQWTLSDSKGARWPPTKEGEFSRFRGITDKNLNPKPIYSVYQLMISKLDGFEKAEKVGNGSNKLFGFLFKNRRIFVAWNDSGANTLSLGVGKVRITDPFGTVTISSGRKLNVTTVPVFIEEIN